MNKFDGVSDTLFIPLTARIYVSKRFPEYFFDNKALKLELEFPDHSIEEKSSEYSMIASAARYYNMDQMVKKFTSKHDRSNIIYLGCGLETAYNRLADTKNMFYELDLPDVIQIRRRVLKEHENERFIEGDLFNLTWTEQIEDKKIPTLMVVSGVFQYFHEEQILKFIRNIKGVFDHAQLIFDATNKSGVNYAVKYVKKTGNKSAMMYFYVDDPRKFAQKAGVRLIECRPFYTDARRIIGRKTNLYTRIAMKVVDDFGKAKILHVRL